MAIISEYKDLDSKENTNVSKITNKGILVFTMHRSASMLIHYFCRIICDNIGMTYYSPNEDSLPESEAIFDEEFWEDKSGCFGPIRWFVNVPNIDNYKIILHLRDPRDVLVSMFYMYGYAHNGQIAGYSGCRKEVADKGIDDFVLTMTTGIPHIERYGTGQSSLMGNVLERYESYIANLLYRPNVTFIKYEEMVNDFPTWIHKLLDVFEPPNKNSIADVFIKRAKVEFSGKREDKWEHIRKITPGDYKEKLKPETIVELNKRFENVLDRLDYSCLQRFSTP